MSDSAVAPCQNDLQPLISDVIPAELVLGGMHARESVAYHCRRRKPKEPINGYVSDVNCGDCLWTVGRHKAEMREVNRTAAIAVRPTIAGDWMPLGSRTAARASIAVFGEASGPIDHVVPLAGSAILSFAIMEGSAQERA